MNTNHPVTESELKAHSTAPRVTEKVLKENISSVHFINLAEALAAQGLATFPGDPRKLLTICVIVLKNGFTIVGESACASPENFNREIGERLAYSDAEKKIWPLMGYALRDHIAYGGMSYWAQPATRPDFLDGDARRNGIDLLNAKAREVYDSWADQEGWVPWVIGGNSDKQEEARAEARKLLGVP